MDEYELIATIPVNLGHWTKVDETHRGGLPDGWQRYMFQEAVFNFDWLPKGVMMYGKLAVEIKTRHWKLLGLKSGVALGWQKAVRDGGRGQMDLIHGSEIWMNHNKVEKWELYESDYFPLPYYPKPILLWMLGYGDKLSEPIANSGYSAPGLAMWTLGIFKKVE